MNFLSKSVIRNITFGIRFYSYDTTKIVVPKRFPSSFFLFVKERRNQTNYTGKTTEFIKDSSQVWKTLSTAEKQPYVDQMISERQKYKDEMEKLTDFEIVEIKKEKREKRLKLEKRREKNLQRKMGLPRHNLSAYSLFLSDQLKGNERSQHKIIFQQSGAKWKKMSEADKQVYFQRAKMDKERYESEMELYAVKMVENKSEYLIPQAHFAKIIKKQKLLEKEAQLEATLSMIKKKITKLV